MLLSLNKINNNNNNKNYHYPIMSDQKEHKRKNNIIKNSIWKLKKLVPAIEILHALRMKIETSDF